MLEILQYPDLRLKQVSKPVDKFNHVLHRLLDDMAEAMYHADGIGLAAAQVGQLLRCFIIDLGMEEGQQKQIYEFVNPKISNGEGKVVFEEGCLSVPGVSEEVTRKSKIKVSYQDRKGQPQTMEAEDLLAVAIQHENDHLDGVLFVDRLSALKRRFVKAKLNKVMTL